MEKIITDNTKYLVTKLVHVHQQKYIDHILSMYQVFPVCFGGPYAISRGGSRGEGTHPAPPRAHRLSGIRTHNVSGDRHLSGADPGFQVRGEGHTYKNCAERREGRTFLGYFV
jgi:hypothetical protein